MTRKIIFAFFIGILIGGGYALYLINNPVSPLETIVNDDSTISITYSRPFKKERIIFVEKSDSALVPYGQYWRTGANKHTYVENTKEIEINRKLLNPGKYSIFSIPGEDEWEVFDKDAEWFAYKWSDENLVGNDFHKLMYNFYEATKGKGSITIGY